MKKSYEIFETIIQAVELITSQNADLLYLSSALGRPAWQIRNLSIKYGFQIPGIKYSVTLRKSDEFPIAAIREAMNKGRKPNIIRRIINPDRFKIKRESKLDELISEGTRLKHMVRITKRSYYFINKYMAETGQYSKWKEKVSKLPPKVEHIPMRDEMIPKGLPIEVMRKAWGLKSGQAVRDYIKKTNSFEIWDNARNELKAKSKKSQSPKYTYKRHFIALLKYIHSHKDLPSKERWPYEATLKYISSTNIRYLSIKRVSKVIIPLFKRYHKAKQEGYKLTLEELTQGLPTYASSTAKILAKAKVQGFYCNNVDGSRRRKRKLTPKYKKQAIDRSYDTNLKISAIASLLNINLAVVGERFGRIHGPRLKTIYYFMSDGRKRKLTPQLASEIFYAQSQNYSKKDICYMLDIPEKFITHIEKNREQISTTIITALRTIYPNKNITTPYL